MEVLKKTAIYPRVSTESQHKEGISFDAQEKKFRNICSEQHSEIVACYKGEGDVKDDKSASIKDDSICFRIQDNKFIVSFDLKKRPNFRQMLIDAKLNKFDQLMFFKWDRFSRNIAFQNLAIIYLKRCGIELYPTDDTNDPLAMQFISVMNEQEPKRTAQRLKLTLQDKFDRGIMVNPKMPLGYKWNKKQKIPEIDVFQSKKVKGIFLKVSEGEYYKDVCKAYDLSYSNLYALIRNRVYIGIIEFNGESKKGIHAPIISEELFTKANEMIANG